MDLPPVTMNHQKMLMIQILKNQVMNMDPLKSLLQINSGLFSINTDFSVCHQGETIWPKPSKLYTLILLSLSLKPKEVYQEVLKIWEISKKASVSKLFQLLKNHGLCVWMTQTLKRNGLIPFQKWKEPAYKLETMNLHWKENILLIATLSLLSQNLHISKLDLMENKLIQHLKELKAHPLALIVNGLFYKVGQPVPWLVEEEPRLFIEDANPELIPMVYLVSENPLLLKNVTPIPVLLHLRMNHPKKSYLLKLKSWNYLTDLKDMRPVSSKKEIWWSLEMIWLCSKDPLEFQLELFSITWP